MILNSRIIDALNNASLKLKSAKIDTYLWDAELLLKEILLFPTRVDLYLHGQEELDLDKLRIYEELINRRISGEPVAYIIGRWQFIDWEFKVSPAVMIPRSETEILVSETIRLLKEEGVTKKHHLKIIDLCTGSGIIGISLAKILGDCQIYATDLSEEALAVANENANNLRVSARITFLKGHLFEPIKLLDLQNAIDVIISNPPYVEKNWLTDLSTVEPQIALNGGKDGMDFYPIIISEAKRFLKDRGYLILEVGATQAKSIFSLLINEGYGVEIIKDYQEIERVLIGRKYVL